MMVCLDEANNSVETLFELVNEFSEGAINKAKTHKSGSFSYNNGVMKKEIISLKKLLRNKFSQEYKGLVK